jgi:hypothetical protein
MNIYYHAGNQANNYTFEIMPLINELKKRGHNVQHLPEKYSIIEKNAPVFTNVPSLELFAMLEECGKGKLFQITRSTDTVYHPRWIAKSAFKVCVSCQREYDAVSKLIGKEKVVLTGMPYLDYYAKSKEWNKEELNSYVPYGEKYILGLQLSHGAHSWNHIEYSEDFRKHYYQIRPKEFPYKTFFKTHQNHMEGWPKFDGIEWIDAHHSLTPQILYFSEGLYASHLSFMILEAIINNKPIYIHEPSDAWMQMRGSHHYPGCWSDFNWWELEDENKRKEVASWFPPIGSNSKRIADLIESCA